MSEAPLSEAMHELARIGEAVFGDAPPAGPIHYSGPTFPAWVTATELSPTEALNARGDNAPGRRSLVKRLLTLAYLAGLADGTPREKADLFPLAVPDAEWREALVDQIASVLVAETNIGGQKAPLLAIRLLKLVRNAQNAAAHRI